MIGITPMSQPKTIGSLIANGVDPTKHNVAVVDKNRKAYKIDITGFNPDSGHATGKLPGQTTEIQVPATTKVVLR